MSIKQSDSAKIYLSRYFTSSSLCENITPNDYEMASPFDKGMQDVYFPFMKVLNRRIDILDQLPLENDPNRRAMLLSVLQQLPSSANNLSDDELISLLKNKLVDSPTELEDYINDSSKMLDSVDSNSFEKNESLQVDTSSESSSSSSETSSET